VLRTNGAALGDITLTAEDFSDPNHSLVFDAMRKMHQADEHIDFITLGDKFIKRTDIGAMVFGLTDYGTWADLVDHYARIVARAAMQRRLSALGTWMRELPDDMATDTMVEQVRKRLEDAFGTQKSKLRMLSDLVMPTLEEMEQPDTIYPSPWRELDTIIGGFRPGALYIVGARPGEGKTLVGVQIAMSLARRGHVAFSTLEMRAEEITKRILSAELGIQLRRINDSTLSQAEWGRIGRERSRVESLPIAVDDSTTSTPTEIRAHARMVSQQGKLVGIVVDYIQLMTARSTGESDNRQQQVAEFSRALKLMAKALHVPVIALSQLNRGLEGRADKSPKISDLRESGAIEQDADVVMLLSREGSDYFIGVAKNRHGPRGTAHLLWDGEYARVLSLNPDNVPLYDPVDGPL
jgi:replicative DNA helicase